MQPRASKWLNDILDACAFIVEITENSTGERFARDRLLRNAVERNLEIIGEALLRLERIEPTIAAQIPDYRAVIGLRNRLVHSYDDIDAHRLWHIVARDLPGLQQEVASLVSDSAFD